MPELKKINTDNLKTGFNKRLRSVAENSFATLLALFIIALIFGAIIFVRCSILVEMPAENTGEDRVFKFESKTYQKILEEWQARNERFSQIENKKYSNPFSH